MFSAREPNCLIEKNNRETLEKEERALNPILPLASELIF